MRAGMIKNNRSKYKPLARMWREHCQPLAAMRVIGKEHNLSTVVERKHSFCFFLVLVNQMHSLYDPWQHISIL